MESKSNSEIIREYFNRDETIVVLITPTKKSEELTRLRKIGDKLGQYVTSFRYLDALSWDCDNTEVSFGFRTGEIVYSTRHKMDECYSCERFKKDIKKNLIVGIKIYMKGAIPLTYKSRVERWKRFTHLLS